MLLADRVAIVTGGAGVNGLGFCTARMLAEHGAKVVIADLESANPANAAEILGKEHLGLVVDVTKKAQCDAAVAKIVARYGRLDILVNNAGITRDGTFKKMNKVDWDMVMRTNLDSLFNLCKPTVDGMVERGWGRVINISSINGQKGQMGQTNYSAAKAGVIGFTKALALENARKGVTVNCIAPGYIDT